MYLLPKKGFSFLFFESILTYIIQPSLDRNANKIQNSSAFINEAEKWTIDPQEVQDHTTLSTGTHLYLSKKFFI